MRARGTADRRATPTVRTAASLRPTVHLLDYGAGNVRSVRNAIARLGFKVEDVTSARDLAKADRLLFPGVGSMGSCMDVLRASGAGLYTCISISLSLSLSLPLFLSLSLFRSLALSLSLSRSLSRSHHPTPPPLPLAPPPPPPPPPPPSLSPSQEKGYVEPLRDHLGQGKPFYGICLGLQCLFDGSEESGGVEGLGVVPGTVRRFRAAETAGLPVPHIGWNTIELERPAPLLNAVADRRLYYVHSYHAAPEDANRDWVLATTQYRSDGIAEGNVVAAVNKGDVYASQFHPEKSGEAGLAVLRAFLDPSSAAAEPVTAARPDPTTGASGDVGSGPRGLARRVIACLDVRANDRGDLVVTKGDQYDVREADSGGASGDVRNLGKPVEVASRYFAEGADEVTFLNITGFRDCPMEDLPMLEVLRRASEGVFVPLTVGGGIRGFTDDAGRRYSALEVAAQYFRSGADKVSIGSDAVDLAEAWMASGGALTGESSIEQISERYGRQAVVVSIDPRRVWVASPSDTPHHTTRVADGDPARGPNGEEHCWWQCTVRGGREGRDVDAVQLAVACEALGAGEILLNCIDKDGTNSGFELPLVRAVSDAVGIPVIASSGAGRPAHFVDVLRGTGAAAALAAGIFHRREVGIDEVKSAMAAAGVPVRLVTGAQ